MAPWTDAEKLVVLFQMIDKNPIDWKSIVPPEGRDTKSVQNMYFGEKKKAGLVKGAGSEGADTEKPAPKKATPKKAATPRKKKDATEDGDGTPKKTRTPRKKKDANEDGDETPSKATPKRKRDKATKKGEEDDKTETDPDMDPSPEKKIKGSTTTIDAGGAKVNAEAEEVKAEVKSEAEEVETEVGNVEVHDPEQDGKFGSEDNYTA